MNLAGFFGWPTRLNGSGPRTPSRAARKAILLCRNLLSERGEVSGTLLAGEALTAYQALDETSRAAFFDLLVQEFSPDPEKIARAGDAYRDEPSPANLARLQAAVESPRQELFRRLNLAAGGTRILVELRAGLLRKLDQNPHWEPVVDDLERLLIAWFNRGFLQLRRIDWRTSALVLEKLIRYEAVHQIQGWEDLRRRLEADRRCYAFFHPALPDEPIIFIEVALTHGMADKVQPLLDPDSPVLPPEAAECAMFYSITNCQEGLRGVPFGSFLIKQVVEDVGREVPRIRKFATVSPVPGFREWLAENPELAALQSKLAQPKWWENQELAEELRHELVPLCARYLLQAKHGREPLDPVARFHLRNGARLERINWLGDTSAVGMHRSAGIMVNYLYRLGDLEKNHEAYTRDYEIVAASEIESLARRKATRPANPSNGKRLPA
ncbi:MAG TPA: malonyl-CoA decarboxylase [Bryobacteraceae bacterium]|nr:malonyl-CoA decarboxylase [Bryobacteraceae bacterium]